MNKPNLLDIFQFVFQTNQHPRSFFAPGRINLIGEHTDYNGGYVFPAAISFGTYALATKRTDRQIRLYSLNFSDTGIITCTLDELAFAKEDSWANYPKGMIAYMQQETGYIDTGVDMLFYGNIPNGAGLSSSASIEMATAVTLEGLFDLQIEPVRRSELGQQVENEYIGVESGIMDQFAIALGKRQHAIHLHTDTLTYTYAPLPLKDHTIVIIDTNKSRTLAGSAYNERRQSCRAALVALQSKLPVTTLADVTPEQFTNFMQLIPNPEHQKRAKHVIEENERTKQALKLLQNAQLEEFGQLMNDSHRSLQTYFEVTGKELDTLVEAAWQQKGVIGARMTGAGFGGCAIAIVKNAHLQAFEAGVSRIYEDKIGYLPTFYKPDIADGASEICKERGM